jgi:hypothetical protein
MASKITVELDIDPGGRGAAAIKGIKSDLAGFEEGTRSAARGGTDLLSVFSGNVLADFFQRGTSAATAFAAQAVRAAAEADDANSVLIFSATQAGIAYDTAATQAEAFGKRVGSSNTEAARTYSELIRLAAAAGRSSDVELIGQRFADLAAARGLKGNELSVLAKQIATGTQDEALNKFGLADPSKLYIDFVANLNAVPGAAKRTVESLNEMEKAQARLNPLVDLGAKAQGESEKRLGRTSGELDTASAAYTNLTTQIGEGITQSVQFKEALVLLSEGLGSLVTSHAKARRELALGLKTPKQLAQETREGTGRQILNAVSGIGAFVASPLFTLGDAHDLVSGKINLDEFYTRSRGTQEAILNPGQPQYEADLESSRQTKRELDEQEVKAQTAARDSAAKAAAAVAASAADAQAKATKKAAQEAESAYKAALGFIDDIAARSSGTDNPFVKLFTEGETAAERMQERFGALGAKVVDEFTAMERKALDVATATQRIEHNLKAVELESQADAILNTYIGITAEMGRQLGIQQKQFDAATNVYKLRREAVAFERGFVPQNGAQQRREDRENYERVKD